MKLHLVQRLANQWDRLIENGAERAPLVKKCSGLSRCTPVRECARSEAGSTTVFVDVKLESLQLAAPGQVNRIGIHTVVNAGGIVKVDSSVLAVYAHAILVYRRLVFTCP